MNEIVLDASVILAILFNEPGPDALPSDFLERAILSTVNLAEAQTKLLQRGFKPELAWEGTLALAVNTIEFSAAQARIAGDLILQTQPRGLSLGDRSCLALAIERQAPVYTTDQAWHTLDLGIPIHVIR
jgi:PIN domain nuclease of toxin-antitoxin system